MAIVVTWDGTTNEATDFDPQGVGAAGDQAVLRISPTNIKNIEQVGADVVFTSVSGFTLTLQNTTLNELGADDFILQDPVTAANTGGQVLISDTTNFLDPVSLGNNINGTAFGDIIMGLGGSDVITTGNGDNLVFGGSSVNDPADLGDTITGGTGNDVIYGNGGNDTINAGIGSNVVYGGGGVDSITTAGGAGALTVAYGGGGGVDPLETSADTITVGAGGGTHVVYGNGGNDIVNGAAGLTGTVTVFGGRGNDSITLNGAGVTVNIHGDGSAATSGVADGTDTISLSGTISGNVFGNGGNDTISATGITGGFLQIFGGSGAFDPSASGVDTITYNNTSGSGSFRIFGNDGNDVVTAAITGSGGESVIFGGRGDDKLTGTVAKSNGDGLDIYGDGVSSNGPADGNDTIRFNGGSVVFSSTTSADSHVFAGGGNDDITFDLDNQPTNANPLALRITLEVNGGAGADAFHSIFNGGITSPPNAPTLFTQSLAVINDYNFFEGDTITNNQTINEGAVINPLNIVDYNHNGTYDIVVADENDIMAIEDGVENLVRIDFTDGSYIYDGTTTPNQQLNGGNGNDIIDDLTADLARVLVGSNSGDGGVGTDGMNGGAGNDILYSGLGAESMTGGTGNDIFSYADIFGVFNATVSSLNAADTINDFTTGQDKIDFAAFGSAHGPAQAITYENAGNLTALGTLEAAVNNQSNGATAGSPHITVFQFGTDTYVLLDNNAASAAYTDQDILIEIAGTPVVAPTDFLI